MDFKELFKQIYSRKAAVAMMAIMCLTWIAIKLIDKADNTAEVGTFDMAAIKWMIVFIVIVIGVIAETQIAAQYGIDNKYGREKTPEQLPEEPEEPGQ